MFADFPSTKLRVGVNVPPEASEGSLPYRLTEAADAVLLGHVLAIETGSTETADQADSTVVEAAEKAGLPSLGHLERFGRIKEYLEQ